MIKIFLSHVKCVKFYEKFKIALILANTAGFLISTVNIFSNVSSENLE